MTRIVHVFAIVGLALLCSGVSTGDPGEQGPPFRAGEVVVAGQPADFPGFEALKYLPHAGLTVLRVETGREWGQVQRLRAEGHRAGLNLIGDDVLRAPALLAEPDLVLHLYGKAEARPGRKMGHFTRLLGR